MRGPETFMGLQIWKKSWSLVLPIGTPMLKIEIEIPPKKFWFSLVHRLSRGWVLMTPAVAKIPRFSSVLSTAISFSHNLHSINFQIQLFDIFADNLTNDDLSAFVHFFWYIVDTLLEGDEWLWLLLGWDWSQEGKLQHVHYWPIHLQRRTLCQPSVPM